MSARVGIASLLVLVALAPGAAGAAHPTPRTSLPVVERQVMCVVCGIPLAIAESAQANRERAFIVPLIAAGDTLAQIKQKLIVQYGPAVIATPPGHGFGLVAYLVPIALAILVASALAFALRRWRRPGGPGAAGAVPTLSAADAARLDADLRLYDR